jgi:hypothetical protein
MASAALYDVRGVSFTRCGRVARKRYKPRALHVREYRESEAANLAELYFAAVRHGTGKQHGKEQREAPAPSVSDAETFESTLATSVVFLAEDESDIVGFMTLD